MIGDLEAYRKARRKTKVVTLPGSGGQQMEVQNLSAAGYTALMDVQREHEGDHVRRAMTVVKHGCPLFADVAIEEVTETVYLDDATFLMAEILALSGTEEDSEKNSSRTPSKSSSTG